MLLFCWTCSVLLGQQNDVCNLENTSFSDGEHLRYKLYYNLSFIWIPAGECTFDLTETDSTYEAVIEGRSYGSYDAFFKVRDNFRSSIRKSDMAPIYFLRKVEEGRYLRYDSIYFDYDKDIVISLNGNTKETAALDTFSLEECTQSLVSVMYNLRNINTDQYGPGDQIFTNLFFDKEYAPIDITYLKKEKKKVRKLGRFDAIKIRPKVLIGNVFKEGDVMNVWISDDKNKVPLLIESPIRIGSVKALLIDYKKLTHPFSKL